MPPRPSRLLRHALAALAISPALAQTEGSSIPCPQRPAYALIRYEEDWSFLRERRCAIDWLDPLKYVDLGRRRYLSLGGDARIRYEYYRNVGFGSGVQDDDGYLLQRYLLHADLHLGERLRFFGQLESSLEDGRQGGPRPTDVNRLDVNQLFAEWTPVRRAADVLTIRAGRQEVELGFGQFTSVRDGLNDRLSFDGLRVFGEIARWKFHAMATRVVPTVQGTFDDHSGPDQTLSGVFLARSHELLPGGNAVVYANRRTRPTTRYADGFGAEERITAGTRWWGRGARWDYNFEFGTQLGTIGAEDIRAWYLNSDNGWTLRATPGQPRLGLRFSIGSGDHNIGDGAIGTFSPLFASTAYSGLSGLIGPSNSINIAPSIAARLGEAVTLTVGTSVYWRQSLSDGIYNIGSELLRAPGTSSARHVGTQPTVQLVWTPTAHVTVSTTLSYFRAGEFLRETPPGEDVTYFTAWWAYRF